MFLQVQLVMGQNYLKIKRKITIRNESSYSCSWSNSFGRRISKLFDKYKIKTGQILISPDDTEQRNRALNVRRTFENLLN